MSANLSIDAARFSSRAWKQALRGTDTVWPQQFEAWLSELAMKICVNPTFESEFALTQDRHEKWTSVECINRT